MIMILHLFPERFLHYVKTCLLRVRDATNMPVEAELHHGIVLGCILLPQRKRNFRWRFLSTLPMRTTPLSGQTAWLPSSPRYNVMFKKITSAIFLLQFMFSSISSNALDHRFSAEVIF